MKKPDFPIIHIIGLPGVGVKRDKFDF